MKRLIITFLLLMSIGSYGQNPTKGWITEPFSDLGFTEDLGRNAGIIEGDIKYFAQYTSYQIFFLPNAFVFGKPKKLSKEEEHERHEKQEHGQEVDPIKWDYFKVEFQNTDATKQIIPSEIKQHTRNYQGPSGTIKAKSYDILTYKNLYPNIDMILELPKDGGLKYTFQVHPGGDYQNIEMSYLGAKTELNMNGNLSILHKTIPTTDQAPESFVHEKDIKSKFIKRGNTIGFYIADYDHSKELTIDPWFVTALPGMVDGREVSADNFLHCTVLAATYWSRELLMYDDTGTLLWTWEIPFNFPDISMNPETGDTYVFGFSPNKTMSKVDSLGVMTAEHETLGFHEGWSVKYSEFHNAVIGAGGGFLGYSSHINVYDLDLLTNTEYISFWDLMGEQEDCALFEVDPVDGSFYYVPSGWTDDDDGSFGNYLYKLDGADPTSVIWATYANHGFKHCSNASYGVLNGVNGIACGTNYVYTYDGEKIIKYDRLTGVRADSLFFGTDQYSQYGLDVDDCNNLYIGSDGVISVYSEDLVLLSMYPIPARCYDLKVINKNLYASGESFVFRFDAPEVPNYLITPTTTVCGDCSGSVFFEVIPSFCDVSPPESIVWSPGGEVGPLITDLCAGWYTATATWVDDAGYEIILVDSVEVLDLNIPIDIDYEITPVSCYGFCDGIINLFPLSGSAPYEFTVGLETNITGVFTDLCPGFYDVLITDSLGCFSDAVFSVVEPAELVGEIIDQTDAHCFGLLNGAATIEATGGTGPYTYNIGAGAVDSGEFTDLSVGSYIVTIIDDNGCTVNVSVEIFEPAELILTEVSTNNIRCNGGDNGIIEVSGFGGTGTLEYSIDGIIFIPTPLFIDLTADDYTLTVRDDNGCETTLDITLDEPEAIIADELPVHELCAGDCNGAINLDASGGVEPYSYSIDGCLTFEPLGTFPDRCPADYNICIEDTNGCRYTSVITVNEGGTLVNPTITPFGPFCADDSAVLVNAEDIGDLTGTGIVGITFDPSLAGPGTHTITNTIVDPCGGGTATFDVVVMPSPVVDFMVEENTGCVLFDAVFTNTGADGPSCSWSFGDGATAATCDPVSHTYSNPGIYDVSLTVIDGNGCSGTTTYAGFIDANPIPVADFVYAPITITTLDPTVEFTDRSNEADYWDWTFDNLGTSTDQNPKFLFPDEAGNYTITQIAISSKGCRDTIVKTLIVTQEYTVFVPNIITPDGDAYNEVFRPYFTGIDIYDYHLSVYNRWGEMIFESFNLEIGWNGTYGGAVVQDGVYIWHIEASDKLTDKRREYHGHVTVVK